METIKAEWVNEESITKPTSPNGLARLEAEKSWLSLNINKNLPIQIFRLSGIYSNQNNILVRLKSGNVLKLLISKIIFFQEFMLKILQTHYLNLYLILSQEKYIIYLMTNLLHQKEVTLYGAKLLNLEKPKMIEFEDIENEMLKNFYKDSKKVSNKKMKNFFNYNLKFPTYIEGLSNIRDNFI